jgi:hypothetical protein
LDDRFFLYFVLGFVLLCFSYRIFVLSRDFSCKVNDRLGLASSLWSVFYGGISHLIGHLPDRGEPAAKDESLCLHML